MFYICISFSTLTTCERALKQFQNPKNSTTSPSFYIPGSATVGSTEMLTSMCCRTSLYISTAILWTRWLQLLYMMALVNISIMSRWNSGVVRITPLSMFFFIWLRSIRLWRRKRTNWKKKTNWPEHKNLRDLLMFTDEIHLSWRRKKRNWKKNQLTCA